MPAPESCSVCRHPFDEDWIQVAGRASGDEGVPSYVCGRCTAVQTVIARPSDPRPNYLARVWAGAPRSSRWETAEGRVRVGGSTLDPTEDRDARRLEARLDEFRQLVRGGQTLAPRVLEVGCRDGRFLAGAQERCPGMESRGVEPWLPWRHAARGRGLTVDAEIIETAPAQPFDIVVEFDLLDHLPDPIAHLEALGRRLGDDGHLLLAVSNVLESPGELSTHRLRIDAPIGFTPAALRHACVAAGLRPTVLARGSELRVSCRREIDSAPATASAPTATEVANQLWANDQRLALKRALASHGPSHEILATADRMHEGCASAVVRAAIARDVALACARLRELETALSWLERSLEDRPDPVAVALHRTLSERLGLRDAA